MAKDKLIKEVWTRPIVDLIEKFGSVRSVLVLLIASAAFALLVASIAFAAMGVRAMRDLIFPPAAATTTQLILERFGEWKNPDSTLLCSQPALHGIRARCDHFVQVGDIRGYTIDTLEKRWGTIIVSFPPYRASTRASTRGHNSPGRGQVGDAYAPAKPGA